MKHNYAIGSLIAVMLLLLFSSCERNGGVYEDKLNVLGTFAQISIVGLDSETASRAASAAEKDLLALDVDARRTKQTLDVGRWTLGGTLNPHR